MANQNLNLDDKGASTSTESASATNISQTKPTIRKNKLGDFSSYTYVLSLWMLTGEAYNDFETNGRKNIIDYAVGYNSSNPNQGAYLILQSGGVGPNTPRSPGFDLDYFIDDFKIKTILAPSESQTTIVRSEFSFNVIEPYGFSFLNKLKIAGDNIIKYTKLPNVQKQQNPTRQLFVMGIKFQGYDKNGNILQTGSPGDQGLESYFPIVITRINFKIDGKTTTYSIKGFSPGPYEATGTKRGVLDKAITLEAGTVEEALTGQNGFIDQLNDYHKNLDYGKNGQPVNKFSIKFVGDVGKTATLNLENNNDKMRWAWSGAQNTKQVNEATAQKVIPNNTKRTISLFAGNSIFQIVERVYVQSSYLTDALKVVYSEVYQPDPEKKDYVEEKDSKPPKKIKWYNISTKIKLLGFNENINDYVYDITYVISPYETPVLLNPFSNNVQAYYGPIKRYEYWFTGKNSEVINYEQTNNNGYYIVALDPGKENSISTTPAAVPTAPGKNQPADVQGEKGESMQAQAAYLTNLFDPRSYSHARINILGDPDFLMYDTLSEKSLAVYNQFYDPLNNKPHPLGGQVFIEMNFKEAVDYNNVNGLMKINDQITFWQYPQFIKNMVQGVSFLVKWVESSFSKGKFTQVLDCTINTFSTNPDVWRGNETPSEQQRDENQSAAETARLNRQNAPVAASGPNPSTAGTTSDNGFKSEPTQQQTSVSATPSPTSQTDRENENAGKTTAPVEEGGRE